jgi:hypothetical protein
MPTAAKVNPNKYKEGSFSDRLDEFMPIWYYIAILGFLKNLYLR